MLSSRILLPVLGAAALVLSACSGDSDTDSAEESSPAQAQACDYDQTVRGVAAVRTGDAAPQLTVTSDAQRPKKLVVVDLCEGSGDPATETDYVTVDYVGVGYKSREEFDSSFTRGQPAQFPLSGVIPGWTQGVAGMAPGGARLLLIPADLAYDKAGAPPAIAPNEDLAFIVELDAAGEAPAADPVGP